MNFSTLRPLSD